MNVLLAIALIVTLNWRDNSINEEGFRIYRQSPGAGFVAIDDAAVNAVTWVDKSSAPMTCYRVTAFNIAGESVPSNVACVPDLPQAPGVLTLSITLVIPPAISTP